MAKRFLATGSVTYRQTTLNIAPLTTDTDSTCGREAGIDAGTVEVHDIPTNVSEEKLTMFLENKKRSGGGEILNIDLDGRTRIATVTFKDPQGACLLI